MAGLLIMFAAAAASLELGLGLGLGLGPQPAAPSPPRQIGGAINVDDYPAEAIAAHAQGTAKVDIDVGADGRVTRCTVVESAGHPALDAASCRAIETRFRYQPASANGGAVSASIRRSIIWRLPDEPAPRSASALLAVKVGPDGRVTDCRLHTPSGDPGFDAAACMVVRQHARLTPARDDDGNPIASDRMLPVNSSRSPAP